jgi:hypothetical protein
MNKKIHLGFKFSLFVWQEKAIVIGQAQILLGEVWFLYHGSPVGVWKGSVDVYGGGRELTNKSEYQNVALTSTFHYCIQRIGK